MGCKECFAYGFRDSKSGLCQGCGKVCEEDGCGQIVGRSALSKCRHCDPEIYYLLWAGSPHALALEIGDVSLDDQEGLKASRVRSRMLYDGLAEEAKDAHAATIAKRSSQFEKRCIKNGERIAKDILKPTVRRSCSFAFQLMGVSFEPDPFVPVQQLGSFVSMSMQPMQSMPTMQSMQSMQQPMQPVQPMQPMHPMLPMQPMQPLQPLQPNAANAANASNAANAANASNTANATNTANTADVMVVNAVGCKCIQHSQCNR